MRRGCTVLLFALADLSHPALARTYLNCTTREVIIVNESSEGVVIDQGNKYELLGR